MSVNRIIKLKIHLAFYKYAFSIYLNFVEIGMQMVSCKRTTKSENIVYRKWSIMIGAARASGSDPNVFKTNPK